MQKKLIATAICALACGATFAQSAQDGPWVMRLRAAHLDSANHDDTGLGLTVNNKVYGEVSGSYFVGKNVALDLSLTLAQSHTLSSNGAAIGTLDQLPATLTLQYYFDVSYARPYVGVGVNYTSFSNVNVAGGTVTLDNGNWGPAFQAGVDIPLGGNTYLNLDLKKVYTETAVLSGGTKVGTFKLDPVVFGIGVGWRF